MIAEFEADTSLRGQERKVFVDTSKSQGTVKFLNELSDEIDFRKPVQSEFGMEVFDVRCTPFEFWEKIINDTYIGIQQQTALRLLKRFYRNVKFESGSTQTEPDTFYQDLEAELQEKVGKLKEELYTAQGQVERMTYRWENAEKAKA